MSKRQPTKRETFTGKFNETVFVHVNHREGSESLHDSVEFAVSTSLVDYIHHNTNRYIVSSVKHRIQLKIPASDLITATATLRVFLKDAITGKEAMCTHSTCGRYKGSRVLQGQPISMFDYMDDDVVASLNVKMVESSSSSRQYTMHLYVHESIESVSPPVLEFYTAPFIVVWRSPFSRGKKRKSEDQETVTKVQPIITAVTYMEAKKQKTSPLELLADTCDTQLAQQQHAFGDVIDDVIDVDAESPPPRSSIPLETPPVVVHDKPPPCSSIPMKTSPVTLPSYRIPLKAAPA
jgi:hypothetical protein